MGYINLDPELFSLFKGLTDRLDRLERSARFTVPNVATDPTNPRKGDAWINSTSNLFKVIDKNGTLRVITWT